MHLTGKQLTPVVLPNPTWIPHWHLSRAIAEAFSPDRRRGSGVDLLTNKTLRTGPAAGLPYKLTRADHVLLAGLAARLPSLELDGSDAGWTAFLQAFQQVTPTLNWIPCRPSPADLYADYCAGFAIADEHLQALRRLLATGEIEAVNDHYASVETITADTQLARSDVEKYLTRCRIPFVIERTPARTATSVDVPDFQFEAADESLKLVEPASYQIPPVTLELVPIEAALGAARSGATEPLPVHRTPGRAQKRFTPDDLDYLIQRNTNGEKWIAIAAEQGMALKTLEGHLARHRAWKQEQEQEQAKLERNPFEQLAAGATRRDS